MFRTQIVDCKNDNFWRANVFFISCGNYKNRQMSLVMMQTGEKTTGVHLVKCFVQTAYGLVNLLFDSKACGTWAKPRMVLRHRSCFRFCLVGSVVAKDGSIFSAPRWEWLLLWSFVLDCGKWLSSEGWVHLSAFASWNEARRAFFSAMVSWFWSERNCSQSKYIYIYIFIVMLCCAEVRQQPIVCVSIAGGCRALDVAYNPRLFCKEKRGAQDFSGETLHPNRALACPWIVPQFSSRHSYKFPQLSQLIKFHTLRACDPPPVELKVRFHWVKDYSNDIVNSGI